MKRTLTFMAVLLIVPGFLAAQSFGDSKHDFTSDVGQSVWTSAAGQCSTCHTAHSTTSVAPLWNISYTPSGYSMYTSATMDATKPTAPELVSLACMSCHDGATTVGSGTNITGTAAVGKTLTQDHPISIEYNAGAAEFNAHSNGLVGSTLPLYDDGGTWQVECGSCHNPHNPNSGLTNGANKFLRQDAAAICTTCHNK